MTKFRIEIAIILVVGLLEIQARPARGADAPARDLEKTLRAHEKEIESARGLKFKKPVIARIVPRPREADPKIQGYYSIKDKVVFLYDDIKGSYGRGVLIHEMVHALQDHHFGLAKLHQQAFGSDAELAVAALIEGDATFTMIEVLKKDQPRVAAMLDAPLDKAKNFQNAFLYAQGARYVKALKERGGWKSVNMAYRFKPRTTAAILHPEGVETINLGPGKSRGEYAIIEMLRANPKTAPLALKAAAGWMADRSGKGESGGTWWAVVFSTKEGARRFKAAWVALEAERHPFARCVESDWSVYSGSSLWFDPKGHITAVIGRKDRARVFIYEAPSQVAYRVLRDQVEVDGPKLVVYSRKDKGFISFGKMVSRLLEADLICIGDEHDSEPNHKVQLAVIEALFARDKRLGVGMEMFQRPFQEALDRYMKGKTAEEAFLMETEYKKRWGYPWMLYRPIVDFCRKNGLPLAALNVRRELVQSLSKSGYDKLSAEDKKQLGTIDFQVKEHRAYWYERLAKMHGKPNATVEEKERSYQAMTLWDEYMGASAAEFQKARGLRRLVVLAGSGHIDRGFGIPARAAKRTGGKVATIHIEVGADPAKATSEPVTDFILVVK